LCGVARAFGSPGASLYERILGAAWDALDESLRRAHTVERKMTACGDFEVRSGAGRLSRLLARMLRLPRAGRREGRLTVTPIGTCERWHRQFGSEALVSIQSGLGPGLLAERFGCVEFRFALEIAGTALRYRQLGAHVRIGRMALRIPEAIGPVVEAEERPGQGPFEVRWGRPGRRRAAMKSVLWLLAVQGVIGAFDTLYYHEWRARLPARGRAASSELMLHAARNFFYAILFGTLPWIEWRGLWTVGLAAVLVAEIVLTMADFVVEKRVRRPLGDVYAGERVTHAVMGIVYGAMIACLIPVMLAWWSEPAGLVPARTDASAPLNWVLTAMAAGVLLSGVRDLYAALELPLGAWPWHEAPGR
jgi:hypothetical protein